MPSVGCCSFLFQVGAAHHCLSCRSSGGPWPCSPRSLQWGGRESQRGRDRDRDREKDRDRQGQRQGETGTERDRDEDIERDRDRDRDKNRERGGGRDRDRERQKERQSEIEGTASFELTPPSGTYGRSEGHCQPDGWLRLPIRRRIY